MSPTIKNWIRPGCCGRTAMENHQLAKTQSEGVRFGVLPERLTDLTRLARELRATWPSVGGLK